MTPLFKKLNLRDEDIILVMNAPDSFEPELTALEGWTILREPAGERRMTFAIGFAITQHELDEISATMVRATEGDAIVWLAYPKGTSKKYRCEFNRDSGWSVLGAAGFEPVRQVAIDADWSALRFRRVEFIKSLKRDDSMAISDQGKARTKKPG